MRRIKIFLSWTSVILLQSSILPLNVLGYKDQLENNRGDIGSRDESPLTVPDKENDRKTLRKTRTLRKRERGFRYTPRKVKSKKSKYGSSSSRKSHGYVPPYYPGEPIYPTYPSYPSRPSYPNLPPIVKPPSYIPPGREEPCCFDNSQQCDIFDNYDPVEPPTINAVDRCPETNCYCPHFMEEHPSSSATKPFYVQGTSINVMCANVPNYCTQFGCSTGTNPCINVIENCCPGWCFSKWKEEARCTAFNTVAMAPDPAGLIGGTTCTNFQNIICPDETAKSKVCGNDDTNINIGQPGWNYCQTYLPNSFEALTAIPPPVPPTNDAEKCFASCLEVVTGSVISCCCGIPV